MPARLTRLHRDLNAFFFKSAGRKPVQSWIVRLGGNGQTASEATILGTYGSKAEAIRAMSDYNAARPTSFTYAWFPERANCNRSET